jgi:hypothetical protein
MAPGDAAADIWKFLTPYIIGSLVSMMSALVLWIIKTFNKHTDSNRDILHILVGTDGKNGMRSKVDKCSTDIDDLKLDVVRIKTTLKIE